MDICFDDSLLTPQLRQFSFWSGPSFSDRVKRSKHPESVGIIGEFTLGSPLFLLLVPFAESKVSEMSMNGS